MTSFQGTYSTLVCTNLTQSITRSGSLNSSFTPMVITNTLNFSRDLTLSVNINTSTSPPPTDITLTSTTPKIVLNRTDDNHYVISSIYPNLGVQVNNQAYFKHLLQNLVLHTTPSSWPSPNFNILLSLTDGTTTLTGTVSVGQLNASAPTTPGSVNVTGRNTTTNHITWTVSTQASGPGVAGYYIYRDGNTGSPYATVTGSGSTSYDDTVVIGDTHTYQVAAYDASSPVIISTLSGVVGIYYYVIVEAASSAIKQTNDATSWTTAASVSGQIYNYITKDNFTLATPAFDSNVAFFADRNSGSVSTHTMTGCSAGSNSTPHQSIRTFRENSLYVSCLSTSTTAGSSYSTYSTSPDGTTWTSRSLPAGSAYYQLSACNGLFFLFQYTAAPHPGYYSSTDGINWTSRTASFNMSSMSIVGDGTTFLNADNSGNLYTSTTGIGSWSSLTLPVSSTTGLQVVNNMWFSGTSTNNSLMYSTDGTTYSTTTVGWSTPTSIFGIPVFTNGLYWLVSGSQSASSSDGITWITHNMSGNYPISILEHNLGNYLSIDSTYFYTSTDGIAWSRSTHGISGLVARLSYY